MMNEVFLVCRFCEDAWTPMEIHSGEEAALQAARRLRGCDDVLFDFASFAFNEQPDAFADAIGVMRMEVL